MNTNSFTSWENELYHHGVKGMRWGVTRSAEELGHITKNSREGLSSIKHVKNNKTYDKANKDAKNMSDDELRRAVNRLNMEQKYSELSSSKRSKGFEAAQTALSIIGSLSAITVSALTIYGIAKGDIRENNDRRKKG